MDWAKLLMADRFGEPSIAREQGGRHPFHKDFDRLVFCPAFRRLGRKAQVHPLAGNDHVHTRLTHSMEVSCVGRSLGMRVGHHLSEHIPLSPEELGIIVQAACLAHDIGNPPFGHAGEYAINDWFQDNAECLQTLNANEQRDLSVFDGNAQGFRIVTRIEVHQFDGGLRLTYPTLGTMIKYPWASTSPYAEKGKFSSFISEVETLKSVMETLCIPEIEPGLWARHPLSFLLEAADDICYAVMDLEDAVELGILSREKVQGVLEPLIAHQLAVRPGFDAYPDRRALSLVRGWVVDAGIDHVVDCFMQNYSAIMDGTLRTSLLDLSDDPIALVFQKAKQMARDEIFPTRRKLELEIGAYNALSLLLQVYCDAVDRMCVQGQPLSFRARRVLTLMGENAPDEHWSAYQAYRRVLDYIGGMTDNFAVYLADKIRTHS